MFGSAWSASGSGSATVDPFRHLDGNPPLRVRLVYGTSDVSVNPAASVAFGQALAAAGYHVDVRPIAGQDHNGVINLARAGPAVVGLTIQVAASVP